MTMYLWFYDHSYIGLDIFCVPLQLTLDFLKEVEKLLLCRS